MLDDIATKKITREEFPGKEEYLVKGFEAYVNGKLEGKKEGEGGLEEDR